VELIFNLQLLSCIVDTNGDSLLAHADVLLNCLKKCLQIKNKQAAKHTAKFVQSILTNLTQTYPTENRLTSHPLDLDPSEHLYINDWAYCCDIKDTNINWHVPSAAEYKLVDRILYEILQPQLDKLKRFIQDTTTMDRDSLLVCLELIQAIIQGISAYLPNITGPLVDGCPRSSVSLERKFYMTSEVTQQPPLEFSRQTLLEFFHELKVCLMDKCEDDTKSLIALTGILKHLLINFGSDHKEIDLKWQSFKQSKIAMGNRLNKNKKLIRPMIVSRAYLQHELRILKCNMSTLTSLHLKIIEDLVDLSISSYSQVRSSAQQVVQIALDIYLFGARKILPKIIPSLKSSPEISHEKFKGSLYLLLSPALISAIVHDWQIMRSIVPLLAQADHSEKPTILNLISHIHNSIQKSYDGFSLKFEVSNTCLPLAAALNSPLSIEELQRGKDQLEEFNKKSIEMYNGLVEDLVAITEGQQGVTQWRFTEISVKLLAMLIRHDHPFPVKGLQMFVNYLNHDALNIRKVAIHAVTLLLQQLKRPLKKVPIDVAKLAGTTDVIDVAPGERKDNKWLCLDEDAIESEEVWNSNLGIVNKTRYGYYCYPVVLEGYAPISEQPKLDRTAAEMSQSEQIIFSSFTDQAFVEKLISFLSLEEIKGKDKYNSKRAQMFKNLFRNYGNTVTPCFRPHLEKLAIDSHESSQRCACEIIAGLVRSTNHWSYKMIMDLRGWLEPLIQKVLGTIQVETVDDWVQCFSDISADRDPKRINWLLQLLMKNSLSDESNGSFVESCHLSLLYLSLAQQEWRVPSLLQRLSSHLPAKLDHPFKNVREKLGMVIAGMYLVDARSMGYQMIYNPQLGDFLKMFQDKIPNPYQILHLSLESTELKICKTAMYAVISSYQPSSIEYYQLLGLLIPLAAYEGDEEISFLIKAVCVHLSRREICPNAIPEILELMTNVVTSLMWKAKLTVLLVIQVLVFWNFFNFVAVEKQLVNLLLHLMQDVQVEVSDNTSTMRPS
jgi:proteasome activator subunit 4